MKKMFKVLLVLTMIAGWPLALSALHVLHTPAPTSVLGVSVPDWANWRILTKDRLAFRETFVDTRSWTLNDIADHTAVASRLDRAGLGSAFAHAGSSQEVAEALQGVKKEAPSATPAVEPAPDPAKPVAPVTPAPAAPAKTVIHSKPAPATQPSADRKPTIFEFNQ